MAKSKKIDPRTVWFIEEYHKLKEANKFSSNEELAGIIGYKSKGTITNILKEEANIQPKNLKLFETHFGLKYVQRSSEPSVLTGLVEVMTQLMKTQNVLLEEQKKEVVSKVRAIESNLDKNHQQIKAVARKQIARTSVMMEALDILTKNQLGTLAAKSDIIEVALKKADGGDGKIVD